MINLFPGVEGHLMVVPREHIGAMTELPPEVAGELFIEAVAAAKVLKETLCPEGMNIFGNEGPVAGQNVDHVHLHVTPRNTDDNLVNFQRKNKDRVAASAESKATLKAAFSK